MVPLNTLDPRASLVLDIHELGRRPGAMRRINRTVPAPADLGLGGVVGVPEGAGLELDVRLESVMDGVLVSGTVQAPLVGECVRCLDPVDGEVAVDFQELYAYPGRLLDGDSGVEGTDAELLVEGDLIDLEQAVRDAVVLALPQAPLCRDDCPGLCAQCGTRLADHPGHAHDSTDPRWAALAGLLTGGEQDNETGSQRAVATEEN
ncbi:MAG TPA: DUF177 domain-containing protein [Jiangellaceae bacterium]